MTVTFYKFLDQVANCFFGYFVSKLSKIDFQFFFLVFLILTLGLYLSLKKVEFHFSVSWYSF